jgi:hypothetical protein
MASFYYKFQKEMIFPVSELAIELNWIFQFQKGRVACTAFLQRYMDNRAKSFSLFTFLVSKSDPFWDNVPYI